jgi:CarD family transcriptional regulator
MFEINDYVIYGEYGVCKIIDITTPPIAGIKKDNKYYILNPLSTNGHTVYIPIDNIKGSMRKTLTREEALEFIDQIPYIDTLWVMNDKFREDYYKKAIRSNRPVEWIKIIKTYYLRKEERKAEGKSISATDEKYFKMAELYLYGELSLALGIPSDEMKDYLINKVKKLEVVRVLGYEEFETK